ncbi:MAG: M28 family peptidase [Ignavibacteria bacterium]|nr:M28 family peptidase [Ignavibacteria bacterium]
MNQNIKTCIFTIVLYISSFSQTVTPVVDTNYSFHEGYRLLSRICDEAGGRLIGTEGNYKGISILTEELKNLGFSVNNDDYIIPGWKRGDDKIQVIAPVKKNLRAIALGYSIAKPDFETELVFAGSGTDSEITAAHVQGKAALVTFEHLPGKDPVYRYDAIKSLAAAGATAAIFIDSRQGGMVMCSMGATGGKAALIPAFATSFEDGKWLKRVIQNKQTTRLFIHASDSCQPVTVSNLSVLLPGQSSKKIVVGAHFDSWDLGQGATDNGLGIAQLYEMARLIKQLHPENYYSIEFVWFNGEELGLHGSKHYVDNQNTDDIIAMVNFDMAAAPNGFNTYGYDELKPFCLAAARVFSCIDTAQKIINTPHSGSDFVPFILRGIPALGGNSDGPLPGGKYYHDFGDTFDKIIEEDYRSVVTVFTPVIISLANSQQFKLPHKTREEVLDMIKRTHSESLLRVMKMWGY